MFIVRFQGELHDEPMCHWNFGSPAILGPSRGHPWLLRGSEDPWLSVTVFRREFGASLFFRESLHCLRRQMEWRRPFHLSP